MDDVLSTIQLDDGGRLYIAPLSRKTIKESDAEHMGYEGYFLFETNDLSPGKAITILAKASSFEGALRLASIWSQHSIA